MKLFKMKFSKKAIFIILIIILGGIFYYSHFGLPSFGKSTEVKKIKVTVSPVIQKDISVPLEVIGNVQAYSIVDVKSLVDGQLLKTGFKEGDFVKKGQMLFEIDPRPFTAALDEAKANLTHDQAQLDNANSQVKRNKALATKGFITQQDFDQLIANQKTFEATITADKAKIANAQLQVEYSTINSPIDGRTGGLKVYPGNIIKTSGSTTLVTITQVNPIYVAFSIPQRYLTSIQDQMKKAPVNVTAKVSNALEQGQLSFIDNTVDISTGTIQLKATFANQDLHLWPGQYVNVTLPSSMLPQALLIPTVAIQMGQNGAYVYTITDNKAVNKEVKVGPVVADQTVILSGLKTGEMVVTDGQMQASNGTDVIITNQKNEKPS